MEHITNEYRKDLSFQRVGYAISRGRSKTQRNAINLAKKIYATRSNTNPTRPLHDTLHDIILCTQHSAHRRLAVGALAITPQNATRTFDWNAIRCRKGCDKRCRQGTAIREPRIRIGRYDKRCDPDLTWSAPRFATKISHFFILL